MERASGLGCGDGIGIPSTGKRGKAECALLGGGVGFGEGFGEFGEGGEDVFGEGVDGDEFGTDLAGDFAGDGGIELGLDEEDFGFGGTGLFDGGEELFRGGLFSARPRRIFR